MQPAGQSPQPTWIVTRNAPTPDAGTTSYQLGWPIRPASPGSMPANRGSAAMTRATASASVVTGPPTGDADGDGTALDAAPAQAARENAIVADRTAASACF